MFFTRALTSLACTSLRRMSATPSVPLAYQVSGSSHSEVNGCYGLATESSTDGTGTAEYWRVLGKHTRKKKLPDQVYRLRAVPDLALNERLSQMVGHSADAAPQSAWVLFKYDNDSGDGQYYYYALSEGVDRPPMGEGAGWKAIPSDEEKKSEESLIVTVHDTQSAAAEYDSVSEQVVRSKEKVGHLKDQPKESRDQDALNAAVKELKALVSQQESLKQAAQCVESAQSKYREQVRSDLKEVSDAGFIYTLSADIHGGCAGLYDYGPIGTSLKQNMLNEWINHFVVSEDMLQIESSMLTPEAVLECSGHVAKFADLMVKDSGNGACHRADKLLESHIEELLEKDGLTMSEEERNQHKTVLAKADAYSSEELAKVMFEQYQIKAPETGNDLTGPFPFNLMFGTQIGPTGKQQGYLRPETAQGIFTNFHKLLQFNNGEMPFAAAQIGHSFRNEIAPRAGLLRVREFQMAEIEHFCTDDVNELRFPKFDDVCELQMNLLPRDLQEKGVEQPLQRTIEEAVYVDRIVSNSTLGYYMARTQLYMQNIGIDMKRLRFRQHLMDEMAHYAQDCWDAEILTSYGWIECVGHADRACFDLTQHSNDTGVKMEATKVYSEPRKVNVVHKTVNGKALAKKFGRATGDITKYLKSLSDEKAIELDQELETLTQNASAEDPTAVPSRPIQMCDGRTFEIERPMFRITQSTKEVYSESYVPPVVEPSFGIGRILYSLLEHSLYLREDSNQRKVLKLRPKMAPIKVMIYPLMAHNEGMNSMVSQIHRTLKVDYNIVCRVDGSTASPGKRYSRSDQLGTPFHVMIDMQSLKDNTVTIRERDSMRPQIRVPLSEVCPLLADLSAERKLWKDVVPQYPIHTEQVL